MRLLWRVPDDFLMEMIPLEESTLRERYKNAPSVRTETPAQAKSWDDKVEAYIEAGLCRRCSAQAAWGHQIGFTKVEAPCPECSPLVAQLPHGTTSEWRSLVPTRGKTL